MPRDAKRRRDDQRGGGRLRGWLSAQAPRPAVTKLLAVYGAGLALLAAGWAGGLLRPVAHTVGWVGPVLVALVLLHVILALRTVSERWVVDEGIDGGRYTVPLMTSSAQVAALAWLEKVDASILTIGFLGKLAAIAAVTGSLTTASDPAAAMAGLGRLSQGISAALYATMLGLGLAAWTHCATLIVSHNVERS